jgi:hypothetical protein
MTFNDLQRQLCILREKHPAAKLSVSLRGLEFMVVLSTPERTWSSNNHILEDAVSDIFKKVKV